MSKKLKYSFLNFHGTVYVTDLCVCVCPPHPQCHCSSGLPWGLFVVPQSTPSVLGHRSALPRLLVCVFTVEHLFQQVPWPSSGYCILLISSVFPGWCRRGFCSMLCGRQERAQGKHSQSFLPFCAHFIQCIFISHLNILQMVFGIITEG